MLGEVYVCIYICFYLSISLYLSIPLYIYTADKKESTSAEQWPNSCTTGQNACNNPENNECESKAN